MNQIIGYSGNLIHFVTDKWLTLSIKDIEYIDGDAVSTTYKISGPSQERPTDWTVALKSSSLKESLIDFFVKGWKDDSLASVLMGKFYMPQDDKVFCAEQIYFRNHEEADSRMF